MVSVGSQNVGPRLAGLHIPFQGQASRNHMTGVGWATMYMWSQRTTCMDHFSPPNLWVPMIKVGPSGLVASTSTCLWAIPLGQPSKFSKRSLCFSPLAHDKSDTFRQCMTMTLWIYWLNNDLTDICSEPGTSISTEGIETSPITILISEYMMKRLHFYLQAAHRTRDYSAVWQMTSLMEFETIRVYRETKRWVNSPGGVGGCFTKEKMIELNLGKSRQAGEKHDVKEYLGNRIW